MFQSDRLTSAVTGEALDAPSLDGERRPWMVGGSVAVHVAVAILLVVLPAARPAPPGLTPDIQIPRLVFLIQPGPGGGGGGGGERSPEPPSVQKSQGKDRALLAIRLEKTPQAASIKKEESPPAEEQVKAPVVAQAPDDRKEKGLLEGQEQLVESAGLGEGGGAGSGSGEGIGPGQGSGLGSGWGGGFGGGAYRMGSGVLPPVLRRQVRPAYTDQALSHKVQGSVLLEVVILRDGTVGDVRLLRSLDPGLDRKAVEAVRLWLFSPGKLQGQPVDVLAEVQVVFALL